MAKEKTDNVAEEKIPNDLSFRWLTDTSNKAILCLINELYHESYPLDYNKIELTHESKDIIKPDYTLIIVDKLLKIKYDNTTQSYHIELQTTNDSHMLDRMIDYGIGKGESEKSPNKKKIHIPKQIVIYIEENRNISDYIEYEFEWFSLDAGKYESHNYKIPTFKIYEKDLSYFSEHHLSLLIPFKISVLNKRLKSAKTAKQKEAILEELPALVDDILNEIKKEHHKGYLSWEDFESVSNAIIELADFFYRKLEPYKKVEEKLMIRIKSSLTKEDKEEIKKEKELEIAKKMKERNADIEFIMDVTGLTKEEIDRL